MKIGVVIPILADIDFNKAYETIDKSCTECGVDFDVIFAINAKLNVVFTKIRGAFSDASKVKAFMVDRSVDEHMLISVALKKCVNYDATIIYSSKEEVNSDVVKAFITSWQAGNKIVYLKKVYTGIKKCTRAISNGIYKLGIKMLGVYKDNLAENDIQLLDNDVVLTLNQLPEKSRQLRTLDSFVGYSTDIVHLQVDSREKVNPLFVEKTKDYYKNSIISITSFLIALLCAIGSSLCLILNLKMPFYAHLILWISFVVFLILSMIFNTRKTLIFRAGKPVERSEINALNDKIEFYNMF